MPPRADWACRSTKCQQDGAATVYEDLPITTTRCPVCGSRRITRLYNHVNVALGAKPQRVERLGPIGGDIKTALGVDRMVEPIALEHEAIKSSAREAEAVGAVSFMQPIGSVAGALAGMTKGGARPSEGRPPIYTSDNGAAITPGLIGDRMKRQTHVSAIDRDSRMPA